MQVSRIPLKSLKASGQPRPLVTEAVDRLAASIGEVGLIQPITVRSTTIMNAGLAEDGFQIVAGHHRVAACRALGWNEIEAVVIGASDHLSAELIEIDENLCRSELTASQRAQAIKRRKAIWEALHPAEIQVGKICPPEIGYGKPPPQEQGFAAETAAVSGESKRAINQHLARAEALGDDLPRVAGTSLDKGVELDALAKLPEADRAELIERAQAGEKVSARAVTASQPKISHTTTSLIAALQSAVQYLLDSTDCKTVCDVITLIESTFGAVHPDDDALYAVLDLFQAVGHLDPTGISLEYE